MNFTKKTLIPLATGIYLCAAFTTGCASTSIGPGIRPEKPEIPGQNDTELTKTDSALLTVLVDAKPEAKEAEQLAARVRTAAESALLGNGFTIADKKPDVRMSLSVRQSTFDKSGNYYWIEGSVPSAKVSLTYDNNKVVSSTTFPIVRGERLLGMEKAVASLGDKLVPTVEKWTTETVKPTNFDMAAVTVVIQRHSWFYKSKDPLYVNKFAEAIASMDGVYSCELISGEVASRLWEFRIVYKKTKFPGGLVNKVIETCRNLDLQLHQ